jgi:hypothetical protein
MSGKGHSANRMAVLVLAGTIAMAVSSAATGEGAQAGLRPRAPVTAGPLTIQTTAANGFDWLAKAEAAPATTVTVRRQIGRGSYICSPAGFGRKSRCYSN